MTSGNPHLDSILGDEEQPYDPSSAMYELEERKVAALERLAAAWESIAMQMPAMIEKMGSRGGSWSGKKDGRQLGMFMFPPAPDTAGLKVGDNIRVVVSKYIVTKNDWGQYINYHSPFDKEGNLTDQVGMKVAAIKTDGKKFPQIVPNFDKYSKDGAPHRLLLKRAALSLGEKDGKRFWFMVGLKDHDVTDPLKVEFNGQIPQE